MVAIFPNETGAIEAVLREHGGAALPIDDSEAVAGWWVMERFTADDVREWLAAGCFDAVAAATLRDIGFAPGRIGAVRLSAIAQASGEGDMTPYDIIAIALPAYADWPIGSHVVADRGPGIVAPPYGAGEPQDDAVVVKWSDGTETWTAVAGLRRAA